MSLIVVAAVDRGVRPVAWPLADGAEDVNETLHAAEQLGREADGSIDGLSVDLWRRAAESLGREHRLVPVTQMEDILKGLERKEYDAAIGAITITPARLARVDFSYPAHRSGVAVAVRENTGPMAALTSYGSVLGELTPLVALTFALLMVMGVAMWLAERPMRPHGHESVVDTLRDGIYWAVVTMTTVGYGDMYPATPYGRVVAGSEIVCGLAFAAILTGLTFVRFSRPRAKLVFAANPVVAIHNGKPTLMVRIGNARARCQR